MFRFKMLQLFSVLGLTLCLFQLSDCALDIVGFQQCLDRLRQDGFNVNVEAPSAFNLKLMINALLRMTDAGQNTFSSLSLNYIGLYKIDISKVFKEYGSDSSTEDPSTSTELNIPDIIRIADINKIGEYPGSPREYCERLHLIPDEA